MNFGSTKTKLDYIIENGDRRIDEAVEAVCSRFELIEPEPIDHIGDLAASGALRSAAGCELIALDSAMRRAQADIAQRQAVGLMGTRDYASAGMAAQQNPMANAYRQGAGLHSIGDQHAHGSPLNQLGAAYRSAMGFGP